MLRKEEILAVVGTVVSLVVWIIPKAPPEVQASVAVIAILFLLFYSQSMYEGTRSRLEALVAFLRIHYSLVFSVVISGSSLYLFSKIDGANSSDSFVPTQLFLTALLAASMSALVIKSKTHPASLRIVKGSDDEVYLVENGVKRHIPDNLTLIFILLDTYYRNVERISDLELKLYPEGKELPSVSSCKLTQSKTGSEVFIIWEGHRKWVPDPETLKHFFPMVYEVGANRIEYQDTKELEKIPRTGSLPSIIPWLSEWGVKISQ